MSIFRQTFPDFVTKELSRRQTNIAARTPSFIQQLNTRSAWIRMTSGVNYNGTNDLAKKYVLQGGVLNNGALRYGLGQNGTSTYDRLSPGGTEHRLGIRPMPGITNVSIQSKGAYGSLQEATVSFNCWDIKQLEELEILYMRPGYTVLLEFGWDYTNPIPSYSNTLLNTPPISINDAFSQIYSKIEQSNGNYDALLGYVKNYNWSAREDGGYDCTTTIISLGEVLESLKCNWVPIPTKAFDNTNLLNLNPTSTGTTNSEIANSYERGIIPGLLHELWSYMANVRGGNASGALNYDGHVNDPNYPNSTYHLFMSKTMGAASKDDRGGYDKPLGKDDSKVEGWITLGSFCDLLNNYVLLKDGKDNNISKIITYETDNTGSVITEADSFGNISGKSLRCIANPLSISTNLGVCLVRNDNWDSLNISSTQQEANQDSKNTTTAPTQTTPDYIRKAIDTGDLSSIRQYLAAKTKLKQTTNPKSGIITSTIIYNGNLKNDLLEITRLISEDIKKEDLITPKKKTSKGGYVWFWEPEFFESNDPSVSEQKIKYTFSNGKTFKSKIGGTIDLINYFKPDYGDETKTKDIQNIKDSFINDVFPSLQNISVLDNGTKYNRSELKSLIGDVFTKVSIPEKLKAENIKVASEQANQISELAKTTPGISQATLPFLITTSGISSGEKVTKFLGSISNIYVNINFLYSQAISKNVSSTDTQNTNNISIREYLQGILREVQNSLGNINDFDIQVDNRTTTGRIVDLNYTGNPDEVTPFLLQIHNLNSVVRNYKFQSKIFPEMGSIIAISAQDPEGVGRLGYDNATLVAWNEDITDRVVPKKDFSEKIKLSKEDDISSYILPFLTKMYNYFQVLQGNDSANVNYVYGGLNFAYRDFLAYLAKFDPRNNFKTIIPTELEVTLDGIGGIIIGNLFKINQDIVPKGYRNVKGRDLAYIVTKLGHNISENDWTTTLGAYPIVFEQSKGTDIPAQWSGQQYPGSVTITTSGRPIAVIRGSSFTPNSEKIAALGKIKTNRIPIEAKPILDTIAYAEGTAKSGNNGYDIIVGYGKIQGWTDNYTAGHPKVRVYIRSINDYSTAAGRYQFLYSTWKSSAGSLSFNKDNQDLVGWKLVNNKNAAKTALEIAEQQIKSKSIDVTKNPGFIAFLNQNYTVWASLPNAAGAAGYAGQGGKYSPAQVYQVYIEAVKKYM